MKVWYTAAEIAAAGLPGWQHSRRHTDRLLRDRTPSRRRAGSGGGTEWHITALPQGVQDELRRRAAAGRSGPDMAAVARPARGEKAAARALIVANYRGWGVDYLTWAALYRSASANLPEWVHEVYRRPPCHPSLRRWRAGGSAAAAKAPDLLDRVIGGMILRRPHLSASQIRAAIPEACDPETGETVAAPSLRTVQLRIARFRDRHAEQIQLTTNPDAWKSGYQVAVGSPYEAIRDPNQLWEIDASPGDMLLLGDDGRARRYSLYALIDIATRRMMFSVAESAATASAQLLLRRAILSWGVPGTLRTDRGADFISREMVSTLALLEVAHDPRGPFRPEEKSAVERGIGTVQRGLISALPGFVGHSVADRERIRARRAFADRLGESDRDALCVEMTAADLQVALDRWCTAYEQRPHAGLGGRSPAQVLATATAPRRQVNSPRALDALLMPAARTGSDRPHGLRTVGKKGVRVDHGLFWADELIAHMRRDVFVRLDPADLGRIHIYTADHSAFICTAVDPSVAGLDRQEMAAAAKEAQRRRAADLRAETKRLKRHITPRSIARAVTGQAASEVLAFPQPSRTHDTPALRAATDATAPPAMPAPTPADTARQDAFVADFHAAREKRRAETHANSDDAKRSRFRRALDLIASPDAATAEDRHWLASYRTTPEFTSQWKLWLDHGALFLDGGERNEEWERLRAQASCR